MGAEGAVEIVMRRQVEEADDPVAKKAELVEAYRKIIDVYVAAGNDMIDDVIDPRETRKVIAGGARDGRGQARRAAVEAARGRAGLRLNFDCGIEGEGSGAAAARVSAPGRIPPLR